MAFRTSRISSWKGHCVTTAPSIPKPVLGMTLTFTPAASTELAGIPAHVIDIWPCLHSGDYLVMLEYAQPVKYRQEVIRQIAAFMSELAPIDVAEDARSMSHSWCHWFWWLVH